MSCVNRVVLKGRLTKDPDIRYTQGEQSTAIARFTVAVDRRRRTQNGDTADFISCVAFGKSAEFLEKYFRKGMAIDLEGHIQTGHFNKQDGSTVYTTDVVVDDCTFGESKKSSNAASPDVPVDVTDEDGFMAIPEVNEELPFN